VERLARINKLFPHEEQNNEKLQELFDAAGFMPEYGRSAAAPRRAAAPPTAGAIAPPSAPQEAPSETTVDNLARVSEITRNIYRQGNVKSVLFTAVNEVGRHWGVSRCVAAMCIPGKPPSAALEYCAPQVKPSDIQAIVKLIGTLQALAVERGVLHLPHAPAAPDLAPVQELLAALDIQSLLAVPLLDGEAHVGILILEQCATRQWHTADITLLRGIADQVTQAFHSARLRSLVRTLAVTEEKSGLLKRSSYIDVLTSEIRRAWQQKSPATLLLLNFGKASALVKDCGEPAVNEMMLNVGQVLCSHVRQSDTAVRYDLTTVALFLSDTTEKNALLAADKMRRVLAGVHVPGTDQSVPVNAGIAEAVIAENYDPVDIVTELINRAAFALEIAEAEGGNKTHALAPQSQLAVAGQ
jgi:GAF domain-containing protein